MRKEICCFCCNRKLIVTINLKTRNLEITSKNIYSNFYMERFRPWWGQMSINQLSVVTYWKFNIWQQVYKQINEKCSTTPTQKKTLAELVKMWTKCNSKHLTYFHFIIFKISLTETYFSWVQKPWDILIHNLPSLLSQNLLKIRWRDFQIKVWITVRW